MPQSKSRVPRSSAATAVRRNVETIARLEEDAFRKRSFANRIADAIAEFSGRLLFVGVHAVVFSLWFLINVGAISFIPKFDPYPFMLLSMVVSLEAIFLSTFVLIKQNRMSQRADQRAHLDLQINLLTEQEITRVLRMLQAISEHLDLPIPTAEVEELTKETSVEQVAHEVQKSMEPGG